MITRLWNRIPMGTRSVLFGAHCFFLHPFFVAAAWTELYGFPFDPRLWVAFFVHDLGYWGMPDMDGEQGETHPEFGARIMHWLFDGNPWNMPTRVFNRRWHDLVLYHSRHYAKMHGVKPSQLCFADKLAFCYQNRWLYLKMTALTGELDEYLKNAVYWNVPNQVASPDAEKWYENLKIWIRKYVAEHKDGAEDKVTVDRRISGTVY